MNTQGGFKNNKYLVFALFFALINLGAVFLIFGFRQYGDTPEYLETIRWFRGDAPEPFFRRIIIPLGSLIAAPFEFLGEGAGLVVQNILFYFLSAFLIFKITEMVYGNKKQAFFASLFFVSAVPVITTGLAYLTDMGGWFFYILSLFLTLLYLHNKNGKLALLNGFICGIGVFLKESAALGVPFFVLAVLLSNNFKIKEKILKILYFGLFFSIPVALLQILMFKYFHFTWLDIYFMGKAGIESEGTFLSLLRYLGHLLIIMGFLWPFFLVGLWQELKEKNQQRLKIFLALIPSSFSFLLWSTWAGARTVFFFAPLGMLLATRGLVFIESKLGKKTGAILIILLISVTLALNYTFNWFNSEIAFFDRILGFFKLLISP